MTMEAIDYFTCPRTKKAHKYDHKRGILTTSAAVASRESGSAGISGMGWECHCIIKGDIMRERNHQERLKGAHQT